MSVFSPPLFERGGREGLNAGKSVKIIKKIIDFDVILKSSNEPNKIEATVLNGGLFALLLVGRTVCQKEHKR